jgi:hypothetical protein
MLPRNTKITNEKTFVKSASDCDMKVVGKAKGLEIKLNDTSFKIEPFVTEKHPKDYMIIGIDSLIKNPNESKSLIKQSFDCQLKSHNDHKINVMSNEIEEKYKGMFKTELDQLTACKIVEHRIITSSELPIVQRNFQISKHFEDEIEENVKKLLKSGIIENSKSLGLLELYRLEKNRGS